MSVYITKIVAAMLYPLPLTMIGVGLGLLLQWRNHKRWGGGLIATSLLGLWLCATPFVADSLQSSLEQKYPMRPLRRLPQADAIVLLGGGISPASPPLRWHPNLHEASDRVWYAAQLLKAQKAPWLVVSGGILPWAGPNASEADAMVILLKSLGVSQAQLKLEEKSQNTYENARYSRPILQKLNAKRILLVTSAMHMPRAMAVFRSALPTSTIIAATTDVLVVPRAERSLLEWLPSSHALHGTTLALKERLGHFVYWLRGYIR